MKLDWKRLLWNVFGAFSAAFGASITAGQSKEQAIGAGVLAGIAAGIAFIQHPQGKQNDTQTEDTVE